MSWKYIKDPVHGYIKISGDDQKIIDTPLFQRLRNISHMGTGYLIYPGATHHRFDHSLGVMSLGVSVFENIVNNSNEKNIDHWNIPKDDLELMKRTLKYACLLHDIGHSPFSHTCEEFYETDTRGKNGLVSKLTKELTFGGAKETKTILEGKPPHEIMGCSLILDEYGEILRNLDVNPLNVCAIILGEVREGVQEEYRTHYRVLANILDSPVDVDKFDYLLRDNYMTGANLISLDKDRLLSAYTVSNNNELVLIGKALSLVTNLMTGRQQVYMWIYQHHKIVFTDALLKKIIHKMIEKNLIDDGFFSLERLRSELIDEFDIISTIRQKSKTDEEIFKLYDMWRNRKFLKSCWKHSFEFDEKIENTNAKRDIKIAARNDPKQMEERISQELGVPPSNITVASVSFKPFHPTGIDMTVEVDGIPKSAIDDLKLYTSDIGKHSEVPYIYTKESDKVQVIEYLKNYKDYSM